MIIILIVATASSITALFLRGFRIQNLKAQFTNQELCTPALNAWLIQVPGYNNKMDAYQAGLSATNHNLGVYVLPDVHAQWVWVAGVYTSEELALQTLNQTNLPATAKIQLYEIKSKKFSLDPEVVQLCRKVLDCVQEIFQQLLAIRTALETGKDMSTIQVKMIEQYNQIKKGAEDLHALNTHLQNKFIATVIYTANQNLLGLQELICTDKIQSISLTVINTALLKVFFSLDNF